MFLCLFEMFFGYFYLYALYSPSSPILLFLNSCFLLVLVVCAWIYGILGLMLLAGSYGLCINSWCLLGFIVGAGTCWNLWNDGTYESCWGLLGSLRPELILIIFRYYGKLVVEYFLYQNFQNFPEYFER